jgi:transcriptional regulator GlxA family with amidase domain
MVSSLLHAFIAFMLQQISLTYAKPNTRQKRSVLPYSFAVQRAITRMRQTLDRRVELRESASAAGFRNVTHFCKQFHREVGITPSVYHTQLRLEAAREMLHQPAAEITTTALEFGFSSSQHFSTLFRRSFGLTPRQWKDRESAR